MKIVVSDDEKSGNALMSYILGIVTWDSSVDIRKHSSFTKELLVVIASGFHLFPFRTEKLSRSALMVLPLGGRVGRCQLNTTHSLIR
jgi:hypothetical protein